MLFGNQHMKKENFIKIMLAVFIFMVLVYPEIVMESCLTYEKKSERLSKVL